ncbi:MAG: histidine phosphatase family protein [Planctomycetaceae bacterium]|nr:histidine phosphatase family protein [Planctomycetaceae bacterium]
MPIAAVIRPGETEFDQQGRVQGTLDLPLSERGLQQVGAIIEALRDQSIRQIYTGPHDPARITAQLVGDALGISVKELDALVNVDHGLWQGLCFDDIKRKHPRVFKQWNESPESVCPPGGETCHEAFERAQVGLRKALKRKDNFAVVSCEPMVSLVECILRHEGPKSSPPCRPARSRLVELIEVAKPEAVAAVD